MKTKLLYLTTYALLLLPFLSKAQLAVTNNSNAQQLAQILAGNGVTVSNFTITCPSSGSGTFTSSGTNLGINSGILLTTGNASDVPQAGSAFANADYPSTSDADLKALTSGGTGNIKNKCILEFDVFSKGNNLTFKYVFGSEEYPEYVCSKYNDVFGFFISGNKPGGGTYTSQNIALIPSTTLPVAINTVNPGTKGSFGTTGGCQSLAYSTYYVDNTSGAYIVYDGFTKVLIAQIPVIPCQTYHLKLAIADVADGLFDSGVFLEENSLSTAVASVNATASAVLPGYKSAFEGCVSGIFKFSIPSPSATNTTIKYSISGSAINGTDYTQVPDSVIILAGDTSASITINPTLDGITEGLETVVMALIDPCTGLVYSKDTLRIADKTTLAVSIDDSTLCPGQTAQLTATGGFNYTWSPAASLSNATIANPVANPSGNTTYTCSYTLGTCSFNKSVNVYKSNLQVNAGNDVMICNTASYQLGASPTASNGLGAYTYVWSPAAGLNSSTIANPTATLANTYIVTVTDGNNCQVKDTVSVQISPTMNLTTIPQAVKCFSGNTGSINLSISGGTGPFSYLWNTGGTVEDPAGLAVGTYTVTVKDAINCSATTSQAITQPTAVGASAIAVNQVSCKGGNNGSINMTPTGGTTPYTYLWNTGGTVEDPSSLTAGSYSVTVKDANNCSTTTTQTITEPTALTTTSTVASQVSCNGGNNGSINLTTAGGTAPYTFAWSNGATTQNVTGLTAGTYTATVKDANNCSTTTTQTITEPTALTTTSTVASQVSCNGGNNGSINLTPAGGTAPYTFAWSNGATTQNVTGLTAGTYTATVKDANNCSTTTTQTITEPTALTTTSTVASQVSCNGGNNGSINLTTAGGTAPYTFAWSNGATTQNVTGLTAGTYTATVKDANNCSTTTTQTITEPTALTTTSTVASQVSCNGGNNGSINLTTAGGTAPYTFAWSNGATTQNVTGLTAGTYTATVKDANNCSTTTTQTITEPTALTTTSTVASQVSCNGGNNGSINLTTAGGTAPYTFAWSNGATTQNVTGLTAGTYTATVKDANNCSTTTTQTITEPTALTTTSTVASQVSCNGGNNGSINLTTAGGTAPYTFAWSNGATTQNVTGLTAGTYTATVKDANNCSTTTTQTITEPTALTTTSTVASQVSCNGGNNGSINLTTAGGTAPYTFAWSNGATTQNVTGLTAGTYTATVKDANNCSTTTTQTITEPTALTTTSTVASQVSCNGGNNGSINLTTAGGTAPYTFAWSNGATTQNVTGLTAGTYTATVKDANNCSTTTTQTITEPTALTTTSTVASQVSCNGGNNGSINLTTAGGTAPYTFAWSNGATTQNVTGLTAGTYTATVKDANNCSTTTTQTITEPTALTTTSTVASQVSCNGGNNGSINLTPAGGTTPYTFAWSNGATTQNVTGLTAGTYTATVKDANNCSTTTTQTITEPTALTTTSTVASQVSCNGGNNGSINLTPAGGTTPYTFAWSNGATTQNVTGLTAGTYTATVKDANNCSTTTTQTITEPTALTTTSTVASQVSCNGGNNGSINLTTAGGTAPYTFAWSNGATTQNVTGLTAGTYTATVKDANNCSTTTTQTITEPTALTTTSTVASQVSCNGGNNGSINLTPAGGTTPYSFAWSNGATTQNVTGLTAGTYTATITDANGCSISVSQTITEPTVLSATSTVASQVSCNGGNNGSINLTPAGGTTPYSFAWSNGATTQNVTGLTAGTYTATVKDANNCSTTTTQTITEPTALTTTSTVASQVSCNGGNNGSINLTPAGGTTPYSFAWSNGATTQNVTGLTAGTYTATITDANGCSISVSQTITEPTVLSATSTVASQVSCNGGNNGSINLTPAGGTTPYSFAWSNGATTQNVTGLTAGTYTATITDANGCSISVSQTITEPTVLSASTVANDVKCFGGNSGSVNVTVNGGTTPYSFAWSNGATTQNLTNIPSGTYSATITDAGNCQYGINSTTIAEPSEIVPTATAVNVRCEGESNGSIDLTVTGGVGPYSYIWNTSEVTEDISNLTAALYTVTVLDANSCSVTAAQIVNEPVKLQATSVVAHIDCYGGSTGSISVKVFGGMTPYIYAWSGLGSSIPTIQNVPSGSYSITVQDANNCSAKLNISISQPQPLSFSYTQTNNSCFGNNGGSIDLSVSGGTPSYSYDWSNASTSQDLNSLTAGNYQVTITDAHNCVTVSPVINITDPSALTATATIASQILCNGGNNGAINLVANGGASPYSYAWSNGATSQNINTLTAGSYTATVSDNNGCSVNVNATTLNEPSALLAAPLTITDAKCFGQNSGAITLNMTGGTRPYNFKWNDGVVKQNRDSLVAGTYTLTVTDKNACVLTITNIVNEPSQLVVSSPQLTNVSCNGGNNGTVAVTVTGATQPYTYNWNNGATTEDLVNLSAGTYTLSVTDNNGCKNNSLTAKITQPQVLIATTNVANNVSCNAGKNGAVNLSVTGGTTPYNFNWSNNASTQNITSLSATSYLVTVTDAQSCKTTASAIVSEPAALKVAASQTDVKCNGNSTGSIQLNVSGGVFPYSYNWNNSATSQNISSLVAGNYLVTVTDKNACVASQKISITEPTALVANFTKTDVSCFGKADGAVQLQANGGTPNYNFKWSNGSNLQSITALNVGTYQITISDANGCTQKVATTITQPSALAVSISKTNVSCNGFNNGVAIAKVSGGTANYIYNWSNNFTASNNQNLGSGNYTLTVADAHGCSISAATTITEPAAMVVNQTVTTPLCYGYNTGSITSTIAGGKLPYSFTWNDGSKTQNKTAIGAGTYTVTITDMNLCTVAKTVSVSQPDAIAINATIKAVACLGGNNGKIDVLTTGGSPAYSYLWANGQTTPTVSNLAVGDYTVTVTDKNACKSSTLLHVDSIAPMIASAVTKNVLCLPLTNGVIDLTVAQGSAPYQYFWSNGKTTEDLSNLSAGSYRVTVKDANGCMLTQFYSLKNDSAFHIQASPTVTITLGESTELNVTHDAPGSVSFNWNTTSESSMSCTTCQSTTVTPPYYSHFTVNATDDRGCVAKDTVSVFVIADHKLWVPNAFTPNSDGNNDFFQVFGNYKAMKNFGIKIFDRWGEMVFESESPEFTWDGTFKGALMPPGVYVYVLETGFIDGSDPVHMKGSLTSIR